MQDSAITKPKHVKQLRMRPGQRWKNDIDYFDKLDNESKEFLIKFVDEYYNGNLANPPIHNDAQIKELYANGYRAKNDVTTISKDRAAAELAKPRQRRPRYSASLYYSDIA